MLKRELEGLGYEGGLTILRDFMRPLKAEFMRVGSMERFETLPGRQAQIDWGECGTIEQGRRTKKLCVFILVLGYSRRMYARFTTSMKRPTLLACMKEAFERLGVPARAAGRQHEAGGRPARRDDGHGALERHVPGLRASTTRCCRWRVHRTGRG
ncbi:MAG: DDE-type integrase/transposase/recombinase [Gemmatimonadota bacterium]|nr:DDE-type integrase/transposase/recombinase [Gemmatimonadota bacterium]